MRASGDRGRVRPRAALVTRARARGGEARRAGWPLAAGKREAGPSVLGRGGEGERREREKKRGREIRGDERDGWSRVTRAGTAVRKKREGFGRRKKDRWTCRKESGVGKRVFGTGKSFRELGF